MYLFVGYIITSFFELKALMSWRGSKGVSLTRGNKVFKSKFSNTEQRVYQYEDIIEPREKKLINCLNETFLPFWRVNWGPMDFEPIVKWCVKEIQVQQ